MWRRLSVDCQITMPKSYLQQLPKNWHACAELHFASSRFPLIRDCWPSSASVMARINTDDYTTRYGMVMYQLDFSRRLTVFFDDRTTKRANERVSAPWSAPLAALRGVRFQQPRLSLAAYRRDGNSAFSSAFSTLGRNIGITIEDHQRLSCPCRVRYFAFSRDAIRVIHYREATGAERVKRLLSILRSLIESMYRITVHWHRSRNSVTWRSLSLFSLRLSGEVAHSQLLFSLLKDTLAHWSREIQWFAKSIVIFEKF